MAMMMHYPKGSSAWYAIPVFGVLFAGMAICCYLSGCSQADMAHQFNYGQAGRVTCFSGDMVTLDEFSTGRVESESQSDGWHFISETTRRLVHGSGQCFIDYGAVRPDGFKPIFPSDVVAAARAKTT